MIFTAPASAPALPCPLPLQDTVGDFCLAARLDRTSEWDSADQRPPYIDAALNQPWTAAEIDARVGQVAAGLRSTLHIAPRQKWHKIVAILASNSVGLVETSTLRQQSKPSLG